jgi:hypothetical protein
MNAGNATKARLTAADAVVSLGTDNVLRGLTIVPTSEMLGPGIRGTDFGTLTLAGDLVVDGIGAPALMLTNGTISGSFASVRSTGGAAGAIGLTNVGTIGTTTFGTATDTLRSTTSALVLVNGGNGSFVFPGVITNTSTAVATGISIQNVTGGAITFTGRINDPAGAGGAGIRILNNRGGAITFAGPGIRTRSSIGIDLQNNYGATIAFTGGGLDVFGTAGSVPFNAVNGGTLQVLDPSNTNVISSLMATALNVNGMTIDPAGLNFRSVSANSTSGFGVSGIVVASPQGTGGLTIRGDGTPNSGGNITSMSGYGINVRGASSPFPLRISWMYLANTSFGGLVTSGPVDALVRRSTFSGTNSGIYVDDGTGTGSTMTIDTVTVTGAPRYAIAATPRSGSSLTLTIRGSTLDGSNVTSEDLLYIEGYAPINATIVGNTLRNGTRSQFRVAQMPAGHLLFQDNTVTGALSANAVVIATSGGSASSFTYDIAGNRITSPQQAISVTSNSPAGSLLSGKIRSNIIGTAGVAGDCGHGVFTSSSGSGTHTALVTNNTIYSCSNFGAWIHGWQQTGSRMNATVRNNLMSGTRVGVSIEHVTSSAASTICADVSGNTMTPTQFNFFMSAGAGTLQLPLYSGSTVGGSATTHTELVNYLRSRNVPNAITSSASTAAGIVLQGGPAGITSCPVPAF